MKVLILTVTAGNGHNSAANTLKNRLLDAGHEVKVVDLIKVYSSKLQAWLIDGGYGLAIDFLRPIYDAFYNSYLKYNPKKAHKCPTQVTVKKVNGGLLEEIYSFQPDVIFGTSFYCGMALTNLRRVYKLPSTNIACMLDYVVSPFWEASVGGVDYLTLTNEDFRQTLLEKGFKDENLVSTGIPVGLQFNEHMDKGKAREKLGLRQDLFTVLIFFGGGTWHGGHRVLKQIVKHIKDEIQVVIINGKDEKTKNKIDKEMAKYPKNIHLTNIGFCKEVNLIESACDLMIGKGGGLCLTECINKGLPLLAYSKVPGQEKYNEKYLLEKGIGLCFKNNKELISKILALKNNPHVLEDMSEGLKAIAMCGNEEIFKLIVSQKKADYSGIDTNIDYKQVNKIVNKARKKGKSAVR